MGEAWDVVVVGAGNAGFSAALAAREVVPRVLVLDKAPATQSGGNSYFTAGAFRTTYGGLDDLRPLLDDLNEDRAAVTELTPYRSVDFFHDMERVTGGRCDEELTKVLVDDASDAILWLREKGLRFRLMYDRQSFHINGRHRFWGGLALGTLGGGQGLIEQHLAAAQASDVEVQHGHCVTGLVCDGKNVVAVRCEVDGMEREFRAGAVVLAAGGFEANADMRARYLGPEWERAKVRGTAHNTGEVLCEALRIGAQSFGDWGSCHSIAWDAAAPDTGDWELTNLLSKQSYPIGIVVNSEGHRFLDEGADYRNYTYARYGAEILKQPGSIAYQLFDSKTRPLLRQDEYTAPGVSVFEGSDLCVLANRIGINPDVLSQTVLDFNNAIVPGEFNPAIKDGKRTVGICPPKSNWALALDNPPFYAFAVTCGITFTFGGLRIDAKGRVLDMRGDPIPGLHAAGELVGGLFHGNYPGGAGLTAGTVFGRRAGYSAGQWSLQAPKVRQ